MAYNPDYGKTRPEDIPSQDITKRKATTAPPTENPTSMLSSYESATKKPKVETGPPADAPTKPKLHGMFGGPFDTMKKGTPDQVLERLGMKKYYFNSDSGSGSGAGSGTGSGAGTGSYSGLDTTKVCVGFYVQGAFY